MLFRQAGIFHTDYAADRALFPIPADRWMIGILLLLALAAPLYMDQLYLSSYMLPWLVWTAGALGLNLILGWAGPLHLGYAAAHAGLAARDGLDHLACVGYQRRHPGHAAGARHPPARHARHIRRRIVL